MQPQTIRVSVKRDASTVLSAVAVPGTPDTPYSPVATAADAEKLLKLDLLAELKTAFEENDFMKPGAASPEKNMTQPGYAWNEVGSEHWDRKD